VRVRASPSAGVDSLPADDALWRELGFALHKCGRERSPGERGHVAALLAAYLPAADEDNANDDDATHAHAALVRTAAALCTLEDTLPASAPRTDDDDARRKRVEFQTLGGFRMDVRELGALL
jgi:hypothetical protein